MNKNKKVDKYMLELDHPLKSEMELIRAIILKASDTIVEDIKWAAPTFIYKDNMATFNSRAKNFVNLTFHKGAIIQDQSGLLEGDGKMARVARFYNMEDINQKKEKLENVVLKWIKAMDSR